MICNISRIFPFIFTIALFFGVAGSVFGQNEKPKKPSGFAKSVTRDMFRNWLIEMERELKQNYYDRAYRGIDIDKRFDEAKARINTLDYDWQMYRVLVQILMELNDSHTMIHLPSPDYIDYGFSMQMIGNECLVIAVKKDSNAREKGLAVGDRILKVGRFEPTRANLWQIYYVIYRLDPIDTIELTVQKIDGTVQTLKVVAKTMSWAKFREERKKKKENENREPVKCAEINQDLIACKLYSFSVEKGDIDKMMKKVEGHSKFILDLRGNGGGYVKIEEYLTSYLFDREVKIADIKTRKKTEARMSKPREKSFKGELAVLIDSYSASASEVLARVIQLEKRGRVIGDLSAGAVMTSIFVPIFRQDAYGFSLSPFPLGMNLTVADVVMSDGKSLEHIGVVPDLPVIPTNLALSKGYDPVLAAASMIFGADLTPEQAGKLHFMTEKTEDAGEERIYTFAGSASRPLYSETP